MKKNYHKRRPQQKEVEYIPVGDEKALSTKIADMALHPKTKELFEKNNLVTAYDLAKRNSKQLFKIQGFGKKDLIGVERELTKLGLTLAPLIDKPKDDSQIENVAKPSESVKKEEKNKKFDKQEPPQKPQNQKQDKKQEKKIDNKNQDKKVDTKNQDKKVDSKKGDSKSQEYRRISKGEKFGIAKGNIEIIPPIYDEVFMVKEDMVCVDVDGLFGYVNLKNEMVIEPQYELAQSFSEGLANVMKNDKYGYIDKANNVVIPFKYELATPFEEDGTARVKIDGRWASITKDEKITWI